MKNKWKERRKGERERGRNEGKRQEVGIIDAVTIEKSFHAKNWEGKGKRLKLITI